MISNTNQITILQFKTVLGKVPFQEWLCSLSSIDLKAQILARLDRLRLGNMGDTRSLGSGVLELRIHHGPGHRIYFAVHGKKVILLLCGGSKGSQKRDIKRARGYWKEYQRRIKK